MAAQTPTETNCINLEKLDRLPHVATAKDVVKELDALVLEAGGGHSAATVKRWQCVPFARLLQCPAS